ncbi:hypothetical protein SDC9_146321 [bioreactor metagenome]|uniref:Uncharacterized protein n=1 Tax=bioreactor metagenome TaxID=1076179 RepID=A0A645EBB4_9ZZZZ
MEKDKISRIVIFTNNNETLSNFLGEKIVVAGAGEYEIGGVEIWGSDIENNKTIYDIKIDGVSLMMLGELTEPLSDKKIEKIQSVDVLIAPVTIGDKVSFKTIKDWAKKWGVNYLIPVGDGDNLKMFLDEADEEGIEPMDSLKVEVENLPDGLELRLLKIV